MSENKHRKLKNTEVKKDDKSPSFVFTSKHLKCRSLPSTSFKSACHGDSFTNGPQWSCDEMEGQSQQPSLKQLRRENVVRLRQVQEEEQRKAQMALKNLRSRFHQEKGREMEALRDTLAKKFESEMQALLSRKDLKLRRLQGDIEHLKRELKQAEASSTPGQRRWAAIARRFSNGKHGLSVSERDVFDEELRKLHLELREVQLAKRQLDTELAQAKDREKQAHFQVP